MLVKFLHEIMKQQTSLSLMDSSPLKKRKLIFFKSINSLARKATNVFYVISMIMILEMEIVLMLNLKTF